MNKKNQYFAEIDNLYRRSDFPSEITSNYEIAIIQGIKNDMDWQNFTDMEKLNIRRSELIYKKKIHETIPELVFQYEELVIKLNYLIIDFLEKSESRCQKLEKIIGSNQEDISLFRLRNMLMCELYSINKHLKLENVGHVLFEEIIEPIFQELSENEIYVQYGLGEIKETYRKVVVLFRKKPYNRN